MAERRVTVGWEQGLHARPASTFVRAATALGIPVTLTKDDGRSVSAASLLGVLGLDVRGGDEIILSSDAEDTERAEAALDRLATMVREGRDELP